MWAIGFWIDNFLPIWSDEISQDRIRFDISINVAPTWIFRKAIQTWSWTTVKR